MTINRAFRLTVLLIACTAVTPAALAQDTSSSSLPGGASSLQETYQDWRVACRLIEATKRCALSQQQARQDGQRVLAIELQAGADNGVTGNLILPFGLLLDAGVTLQIDEQPAMAPLPFRTCLPAGCAVPITLDQAEVDALRAGTTLNLTAKAGDTEQDLALAISLNGFSTALDRIVELTEN